MHLKQLRSVFVGLFLVGCSVVFLVLIDKRQYPLPDVKKPRSMQSVPGKQEGLSLVERRIQKKPRTIEGGGAG